ncbi:MAG: VPLPA-CTERM sorting domain-containing protein [Pseudomonadales bacterium]|nr:VPLPA-CTERM sorting domain-containing protein [Pseudomonadales bacterium]
MRIQISRFGRDVLGCIVLFFCSSNSHAADLSLDYYCITNNSAANCGIGEVQLYTEVTDLGISELGVSQVRFDFFNIGSYESVISEVYFDDGTLLGIANIIDADDGISGVFGDSGVDFSQGANPPKLSGGDNLNPKFEITAGFLADADSPSPTWGISPGEQLGIIFNLKGGGTFDNIAAELTDGRLRLGLHVTSITGSGSESFVNNPVPLPAAVWLFGSGLIGLRLVSKRRVYV